MYKIIPAINEVSFAEIEKKIKKVESYVSWVHLDVADGTFTPNILWNNPGDLAKLRNKINIEVHLMIKDPDVHISKWIRMGAKRIVVHVEALRDYRTLSKRCDEAGVVLTLSVAPRTPATAFDPFFHSNQCCFQILSVKPGLPGQAFIESSLEKIKYVRRMEPNAIIEVDGGIKTGIANRCKEAGANLFVASSAIFQSKNIVKALEKLQADIR